MLCQLCQRVKSLCPRGFQHRQVRLRSLRQAALRPYAIQDDLFRQAYLRSLQAARREAEATAYFKTMTANKHRTRLDRLLAN